MILLLMSISSVHTICSIVCLSLSLFLFICLHPTFILPKYFGWIIARRWFAFCLSNRTYCCFYIWCSNLSKNRFAQTLEILFLALCSSYLQLWRLMKTLTGFACFHLHGQKYLPFAVRATWPTLSQLCWQSS